MVHFPDVPITLNSSENDLDREFFIPCLKWATRYDRGVGYFTSGWISKNAIGLAEFAGNAGKARWITSPILEEKDYDAIRSATDFNDVVKYYQNLLLSNMSKLAAEIETEAQNALGWMIYDNILDLRFAVPINKLSDGDFHDKFGIFSDEQGNLLSFTGSINDSNKGFSNYESIKVFKSWENMLPYISSDVQRFEKIWNNRDSNLRVIEPSVAIREKLISLRIKDRPYVDKNAGKKQDPWIHQDEAMNIFLKAKNGILEMATGTGKTWTALKIISKLFQDEKIKRVIITTHGNDLLRQWEKEILQRLDASYQVFRYFDTIYKELPSFLMCKSKCVLIVSRDEERLSECIDRLILRVPDAYINTLLIFDEVHGLGSQSLRTSLNGKLHPFQYRLGLSATPNREYDEEGNDFILQEVGPVIFEFTLEDAIQKGILCEFSYIPIDYELSREEKQNKRNIIARYSVRKKNGEFVSVEELYRDLARVNKTSMSKVPLFQELIQKHKDVLNRCIIFVETIEYGMHVQDALVHYFPEFHTYYGDDDESNLQRFVKGSINCLITCKKISEGIDIKSVNNIILFSSDRGKLVTTQRIGRCLRTNPENINKIATIVDFVCVDTEKDSNEMEHSADMERSEWLTQLSKTRRI